MTIDEWATLYALQFGTPRLYMTEYVEGEEEFYMMMRKDPDLPGIVHRGCVFSLKEEFARRGIDPDRSNYRRKILP